MFRGDADLFFEPGELEEIDKFTSLARVLKNVLEGHTAFCCGGTFEYQVAEEWRYQCPVLYRGGVWKH